MWECLGEWARVSGGGNEGRVDSLPLKDIYIGYVKRHLKAIILEDVSTRGQ